MKLHKLLIISLIIFASSCTSVIKIIYGIKDPKPENENSITEYIVKNNLNPDNVFVLDEKSHRKFSQNIGLPDFYVFNSEGISVIIESDKNCPAIAPEIIKMLNPNDNYNLDSDLNLKDIIINLRYLNGETAELSVTENYDFYIVIYWAKFIGKLNKKNVAVWENAAKNNNKAQIKTLKINMDIQEFWDL